MADTQCVGLCTVSESGLELGCRNSNGRCVCCSKTCACVWQQDSHACRCQLHNAALRMLTGMSPRCGRRLKEGVGSRVVAFARTPRQRVVFKPHKVCIRAGRRYCRCGNTRLSTAPSSSNVRLLARMQRHTVCAAVGLCAQPACLVPSAEARSCVVGLLAGGSCRKQRL